MDVILNFGYREDVVSGLFDIEKLALHVMRCEKVTESAEVSISFVTNDEIHELNLKWRGIDRPTDVLSFECDGFKDDMPFIEGETFELGDIVIAPDVAEAQAPSYGISFADEISLLVTHGLLHLCGYDHMEDDEARDMEERERELLSEFWDKPFKRSGADVG